MIELLVMEVEYRVFALSFGVFLQLARVISWYLRIYQPHQFDRVSFGLTNGNYEVDFLFHVNIIGLWPVEYRVCSFTVIVDKRDKDNNHTFLAIV